MKNGGYQMNKEQESADTMTDELIDNEKTLMLFNDDYNTFEDIINALVEVCGHTREQAETCTWIAHYKNKCPIMSGSFNDLKPYYDGMLNRRIYVSIV